NSILVVDGSDLSVFNGTGELVTTQSLTLRDSTVARANDLNIAGVTVSVQQATEIDDTTTLIERGGMLKAGTLAISSTNVRSLMTVEGGSNVTVTGSGGGAFATQFNDGAKVTVSDSVLDLTRGLKVAGGPDGPLTLKGGTQATVHGGFELS